MFCRCLDDPAAVNPAIPLLTLRFNWLRIHQGIEDFGLAVRVERYPDLKSNQNFLALQSQLEGTENRISVARRDYIDSVRAYNTELKSFPGVIWASTLYRSYKPMETFTVAEDVTKPPTVKF